MSITKSSILISNIQQASIESDIKLADSTGIRLGCVLNKIIKSMQAPSPYLNQVTDSFSECEEHMQNILSDNEGKYPMLSYYFSVKDLCNLTGSQQPIVNASLMRMVEKGVVTRITLNDLRLRCVDSMNKSIFAENQEDVDMDAVRYGILYSKISGGATTQLYILNEVLNGGDSLAARWQETLSK